MTAPKLSFIVLSYNYEQYIGTTLRSILAQTVQDFEVLVVDDCSSDGSRELVRSFGDPRIRLIENERNLGGAGSYNVAVQAARGEWLVNLDADDWIAPEKCAVQLAAAAADPALDIMGSWIHVVGADGKRHPQADDVEGITNCDHQLNRVESWIGQNLLVRSSVMMRRAAHMQIGLDDPGMVRGPDYELWTRALAAGCRFGLVHQPLTFYRLHTRGVTHADPVGTLLEVSYAMARNLAPLAEQRALFEEQDQMLRWAVQHPSFYSLTPSQGQRLLGTLALLPPLPDFLTFRASLSGPQNEPALERAGRHALFRAASDVPPGTVEKLQSDIQAYIEARDYWREQAERGLLRSVLLRALRKTQARFGGVVRSGHGTGARSSA
jgi:GT2 family glycosyltransferase